MMKKLYCLPVLFSTSMVLAAEPAVDNTSAAQSNSYVSADELDSEFFELGIYGGILNVQDFTSEPLIGARATFHASEDFFLQVNYAQAEITESSFEKKLGSVLAEADRDYTFFNFLLGYNVFQGEVFPFKGHVSLSALYLVAGVGDTEFGDEESFTYTFGAGYKVNLTRRYVWSVDFRDHIYQSSLLREDERTHNVEISTGISFLF
jgi:outer membrane beta-barrel protein